MEERLFEASRKGNKATLLKLLEEDPLILEDNIKHASVETPLHIASLHGHTDFVKYILSQKPGFAKALNCKGYSPLHLACANGHVETVKELLKIDGEEIDHELCRQKDKKGGRTPLHLAVIKGRDRVFAALILACPESVREVTDRGETILHLTVRSENGCKMLRGLLKGLKDKDMLNWKDDEGNTVLHLAAVTKQHEVMKFLLVQPELDVNSVNSNKLKAIDILQKGPKQSNDEEIVRMLHLASMPRPDNQALTKRSEANDDVAINVDDFVINVNDVAIDVDTIKTKDLTSKKDTANSFEWLGEMRRGIMVVAVLIATVTFEVALNPPGGVWQDWGLASDSNVTTRLITHSHRPGKSVAGETSPNSLTWFLVWDSIGFLASMSIIVVSTSPSKLEGNSIRWDYIRLMMWVVIASIHMVFLYGVQMTITSNIFKRAVVAPFVFFYGIVGLLALRSGWSSVTEWKYLVKELWTKKKR